jgi:ribosomal protein L11 methyltransferase
MPLYRATTALEGEAAARALRDALDGLEPAPLASEVHDHDDGSGLWDAGGLFDGRPDAAGLALLARLHGAADFAVARVEDRDWVAQVRAELTPVEAGRFVVYGSHDRERVAANRVRLEIEAAQAFGTGHHATTQGCLTALDRLVRRGLVARRVADIGGGTGVLAMAAASVWPAAAVAGDIDPLATATARENVAANGLGGRVACVTAAGFRHPRLRAGAPYGLVFANILAGPLRRLAPDVAAHQAPGGVAILSGILARQAPGVTAVYRAWGYAPEAPVRIGEWVTLVLRRPG